MNLEHIKNLIKKDGESTTLELKKSMAEIDKMGKSICGFLNTEGGIGIIGISDSLKIIGVEVTDSTKKKLASFRAAFDPRPKLKISYVNIPESEKYVIVIEVSNLKKHQAYFFKGRAYIRNESSVEVMPMSELKRRLKKDEQYEKDWEMLTVQDYSIDDLDPDEIRHTAEIGQRVGRLPSNIDTNNISGILGGLGLIKNTFITNAAMVLYAKNIPTDYPQCLLKMGRFIDGHDLNNALDSKQIYCNAFQLFSEAQAFIQKHLMIASHFEIDSYERIDEPTLPPLAIREALVNAICHRDYSRLSGEIQIIIFDDCLEIHNAGGLYGGLTIDQLSRQHHSERRNEQISNVFYVRKLIDRWGSGTKRIFELCAQSNLPKPEFIEEFGGLTIRFHYKKPLRESSVQTIQKNEENLSTRKQKILTILRNFGEMSTGELLEKLGKTHSQRIIQMDLKTLKEEGFVHSKGEGRAVVWLVEVLQTDFLKK